MSVITRDDRCVLAARLRVSFTRGKSDFTPSNIARLDGFFFFPPRISLTIFFSAFFFFLAHNVQEAIISTSASLLLHFSSVLLLSGGARTVIDTDAISGFSLDRAHVSANSAVSRERQYAFSRELQIRIARFVARDSSRQAGCFFNVNHSECVSV